jgi:hypothetical protein
MTDIGAPNLNAKLDGVINLHKAQPHEGSSTGSASQIAASMGYHSR